MIETKKAVIESFHDFWRECRKGIYTFYVCKGGRNSAKSTTISERIIYEMIDLPVNALCIRRVGTTLQESVYEQLKEAASLLGVYDEFEYKKSPLRIIYKPRGNYILFRGADDPQKLKSIKTAEFPIAIVWIEEIMEFKTEEEVQTIIDSILRAELPNGMRYKFFFSYNPPKRKQHWLNVKYESIIIPKNTYIHHSTYLDNYYLPAQTLEVINDTKIKNPKKYEWNYLGKPIGGGILPFDNLQFRKITDDEIKSFDNIRQGIDWGYAVDPFAFVRWHYDKLRRKIYAIDEIYAVKLLNREAAKLIKEKKYEGIETICDSAEPKSCDDLEENGIKVAKAIKGPGSVEFGEKWLDDLEAIIIDPERTPSIASEFESIDYQVDKDGNLKAKLEDKNNHTIDATRYAFERDMGAETISFLN